MIDARLPSEWPESVLAASRRYRQGSMVERPPFFYYRVGGHPVWQVTLDGDDDAAESVIEIEPDEGPPFGLITTQTCDLFEEGSPKQPWFMVAPVYDYRGQLREGQLAQIQRGEVSHLVALTATWLPDGFWVADLRIEVPLEKGWLVGREPREGFTAAGEYEVLSTRLMARRGRPAISTALSVSLVRRLRQWLRNGGRRYRDEVDSLRLQVAGELTTSTVARLLVVADEELSADAKSAWEAFEAGLIDAAATEGVTALAFRYANLDDLSGREIESSVRLDFDFLSDSA